VTMSGANDDGPVVRTFTDSVLQTNIYSSFIVLSDSLLVWLSSDPTFSHLAVSMNVRAVRDHHLGGFAY